MEAADIPINKARGIKLARSAYNEFSNAADFIWKTPRLLDSEREDELAKLPIYFPNAPQLASLRWQHESAKIDRTFPFLMSRGNLFSIASLYESYLHLLAKDIEKLTGNPLKLARGQGVSKIYNYFKAVGLNYSAIDLFEQVDAALKIRNCLFHASGILDWCKNPEQIVRVVDDLIYLSKDHRQRRIKSDNRDNEVIISKSKFGHRLEIINQYPWIVAFYFRDYFVGLCLEAKGKGKI